MYDNRKVFCKSGPSIISGRVADSPVMGCDHLGIYSCDCLTANVITAVNCDHIVSGHFTGARVLSCY